MSEWFEHQENLDEESPPPSKQIGAIGGGSFLVADLSQKCYFWTFQKSQLFVFFSSDFFSHDDFCLIATKQYLIN